MRELTADAPTEHLVVVIAISGAVAQSHLGGVGHRLPDVGSVYQFAEVLHTEKRGPLTHGKAQRVHNVGLACLQIRTWIRLIHTAHHKCSQNETFLFFS